MEPSPELDPRGHANGVRPCAIPPMHANARHAMSVTAIQAFDRVRPVDTINRSRPSARTVAPTGIACHPHGDFVSALVRLLQTEGIKDRSTPRYRRSDEFGRRRRDVEEPVNVVVPCDRVGRVGWAVADGVECRPPPPETTYVVPFTGAKRWWL